MNELPRWVERFESFEKAVKQLHSAVLRKDLDDLAKAGVIQYFEFTFELSWKCMKDFLYENGITVNYPREIIKKSYESEIIQNGDIWIDMLEQRNLLSHTYDESKAQKAFNLVKFEYFSEILKLYEFLNSRRNEI